MIVNKSLLEDVKKFGLNTYEAKIWTALLSRGISTAGELAEIANVPRSRSYDVLESLEKKGFIMMKVGKPIQYLAIRPEQVVERVKKKISEDADFQLKQLGKLTDSTLLGELTSLHNEGIETLDPMDITSFIRGRVNIHSQLATLIKNAKKSIKIASSDEGVVRKTTQLRRYLQKAKTNGVNIEFAMPNKSLKATEKTSIEELGSIKTAGSQARFVVVDNKEAVIMLASDLEINPQYDTAIWVGSEFLAKSLTDFFKKA